MGDPSRWHKFKVWLFSHMAALMPRDLVYFVLLRVRYEVTDSKFWPIDAEAEHENVPSIDAAIGRWYAGSNWYYRPFTVRHGEKAERDRTERQ